MKVAALVNSEGILSGLHEPGYLQLFSHECSLWNLDQEMEIQLHPEMSLAQVRNVLRSCSASLGTVDVLLTGPLRGASLAMLQDLGFLVWPTQGCAEELLDDAEIVYAQRNAFQEESCCAKKQAAQNADPVPEPFPVGEPQKGAFRIDLEEARQKNIGHPSQTVLMPFLHKKEFQVLEILCDHKPRWLDAELFRLGLKSTEQFEMGHGIKITVTL